MVVDRADGDDRGVVARRADCAVDLLAVRVLAAVAGRCDHCDADHAGAARRKAQRVGAPRLGRVRREADVHHADVQFPRVVDDPLDAFDDIGHRAGALVVEHAHVVDVGVRRDAGRVGRLVVAAAGSDRRDVRAVAVGVLHGIAVVGDQVLVFREAGGARRV